MRWTSVAFAMALSLGLGLSAIAVEDSTDAEAALAAKVFSDELDRQDVVVPVEQNLQGESVEWVTPMAPLPPAILCGLVGVGYAAFAARRVKRRGRI